MFGSLKIGTAFGIPVRIHWTFLLLPYLLAFLGNSPSVIVLGMAVVFGCVLLHELGHSLVARSFGIRVVDISFWPLGGLARMSEIPESPRIEGLVAIAGPAVNFLLTGAGLLLLTLVLVLGLPGETLWRSFILLNLVQGLFNLVPAFPMDGGRVLRAFLARKRDWLSATEMAVRVGRVMAALMFAGSIALMILVPQVVCLLPLVAVFVWLAGARELLAVRLRHGVLPFGGGAHAAAAPTAAHGAGRAAESAEAEAGSARRPSAWEQRSPFGGGQGFSEEAIRALENYRGRLRARPEPPGPDAGARDAGSS